MIYQIANVQSIVHWPFHVVRRPSPSMKSTLTWWEASLKMSFLTLCQEEEEELIEAIATSVEQNNESIFFMLIPRTGFKVEKFRLQQPLYLWHLFITWPFGGKRRISCIEYISLPKCFTALFHMSYCISFRLLSTLWSAGVLKVKHDRFKNGDERIWQQYLAHNTSSLICTLMYV